MLSFFPSSKFYCISKAGILCFFLSSRPSLDNFIYITRRIMNLLVFTATSYALVDDECESLGQSSTLYPWNNLNESRNDSCKNNNKRTIIKVLIEHVLIFVSPL